MYGAGILMVLAFCPKVSALIVSIPGPVLGASLVFLMGLLFATGVQLAVSAGVNYQIGVVIGVSFCVGLMMQTGQFFPDILPRAFEPIMTNGLVMGGLTAIVLNVAFHALPGRGATLQLEPDPAQVATLNNFIEEQASSLGLSPSQANNLQLACEEVFMHICQNSEGTTDTDKVQIQLLSKENHIHVDMEDRSQLCDVDDTIVMPKPEVATEADLDHLGLFLLNKVAKEVTHIRISGYNCISFKIY